jgi:hypothetical protein
MIKNVLNKIFINKTLQNRIFSFNHYKTIIKSFSTDQGKKTKHQSSNNEAKHKDPKGAPHKLEKEHEDIVEKKERREHEQQQKKENNKKILNEAEKILDSASLEGVSIVNKDNTDIKAENPHIPKSKEHKLQQADKNEEAKGSKSRKDNKDNKDVKDSDVKPEKKNVKMDIGSANVSIDKTITNTDTTINTNKSSSNVTKGKETVIKTEEKNNKSKVVDGIVDLAEVSKYKNLINELNKDWLKISEENDKK